MMVAEDERTDRSTLSAACWRCRTTVVPTVKNQIEAAHQLLTRTTQQGTVTIEQMAAAYAARDADWERDWDHGADHGSWLCSDCRPAVVAERTSPCTGWCADDCEPYSFFTQGTTHRRCFINAAGEVVAEIDQNDPFADPEAGWTNATIFDGKREEKSLAQLRELAALVTKVADFVETHNLVLTTEVE